MTENLDNLPGIARRREEERKKLQESEHPTKSEYLLKICIIGTNFNLRRKLIRSSNGDHFDDQTHLTTGVDISTLKITVKNTPTKLILINSIDRIKHYLL